MTLLYPMARWRPIESHGGLMRRQTGLVEHITTNDASPFGYFSDPRHKASSHLWLDRDGYFEQYIDLELQSWAQAGGNSGWTSVEVSGLTGTGKTPAQTESLAHLFAWGSQHPRLLWPLRLTDDPAVGGLGWHGMGVPAWGSHPDCPGRARLAQRVGVMTRAQAIVAGHPAPTVPAHPPITTEDPMARLIRPINSAAIYGTDGVGRWAVPSPPILADLVRSGIYGDGAVTEVGQQTIDSLPLVSR